MKLNEMFHKMNDETRAKALEEFSRSLQQIRDDKDLRTAHPTHDAQRALALTKVGVNTGFAGIGDTKPMAGPGRVTVSEIAPTDAQIARRDVAVFINEFAPIAAQMNKQNTNGS